MSTVPGILNIQVPDQGLAVIASQTLSAGTKATKGTATDLVLVLSATGITGTPKMYVQGSNDGTGFTNPVVVTPDKVSSNLTVNGDGSVSFANTTSQAGVLHLAQLQYAFYRVAVTTAASTTVTLTDDYVFVPVQDTFSATVA